MEDGAIFMYIYLFIYLFYSGQTSILGVVFFAPKSLLGIERQKKLKNYNFDPKASKPS